MQELYAVCNTKGGTVQPALLKQVMQRVFKGTEAIQLNEQATRARYIKELSELENVEPSVIDSLNLSTEQLVSTIKVKTACAAVVSKKQPSGKVGAPQSQSSAKRPAQEPKKPEPVSEEDERYDYFRKLMSASDGSESGWPVSKK
jgi:hypothetical protein